jgi:hypothetical protein
MKTYKIRGYKKTNKNRRYRKTRKIQGGLWGTNTQKQIEWMKDFFESFFKTEFFLKITEISKILDPKDKDIRGIARLEDILQKFKNLKDIQTNKITIDSTKKIGNFFGKITSKLSRNNVKTDIEQLRNLYLDLLLELIYTTNYKANEDLTELIKVIMNIKKYNNDNNDYDKFKHYLHANKDVLIEIFIESQKIESLQFIELLQKKARIKYIKIFFEFLQNKIQDKKYLQDVLKYILDRFNYLKKSETEDTYNKKTLYHNYLKLLESLILLINENKENESEDINKLKQINVIIFNIMKTSSTGDVEKNYEEILKLLGTDEARTKFMNLILSILEPPKKIEVEEESETRKQIKCLKKFFEEFFKEFSLKIDFYSKDTSMARSFDDIISIEDSLKTIDDRQTDAYNFLSVLQQNNIDKITLNEYLGILYRLIKLTKDDDKFQEILKLITEIARRSDMTNYDIFNELICKKISDLAKNILDLIFTTPEVTGEETPTDIPKELQLSVEFIYNDGKETTTSFEESSFKETKHKNGDITYILPNEDNTRPIKYILPNNNIIVSQPYGKIDYTSSNGKTTHYTLVNGKFTIPSPYEGGKSKRRTKKHKRKTKK